MTGGGNAALLTRTSRTGAAWLSSARALKCSLKWGNERNPYYALQVSRETAPPCWRKLENNLLKFLEKKCVPPKRHTRTRSVNLDRTLDGRKSNTSTRSSPRR